MSTAIRSLTLWPEWAWAIHHLDKRVENRTWALPVGEWFALHAGRHIGGRPGAVAGRDGLDAMEAMAERASWHFFASNAPGVTVDRGARVVAAKVRTIQTSAILGVFRVTRTEPPNRGDLRGWRVPEQVGNVFEYRPLASPILGVKGAQGLWTLTVPVDVPEVSGG